MFHRGTILSISLLVMFTPRARADFLLGKDIQVDVRNPSLSSPPIVTSQFVVGSGPELSIRNHPTLVNVDVDVSDSTIRLTYPDSFALFAGGAFNGYIFTDFTDSIPPFGEVLIDSETNLPGLDPSRVSFDADHVYLNLSELAVRSPNTVIQLRIGSASVPEPSSCIALSIGVLGMSAYVRYRRAKPLAKAA
jgi:hypothetical protein